MKKLNELIELYCTISDCKHSSFLAAKQRLSNNSRPKFTDDELITVYFWGIYSKWFGRKAIYDNAKNYLQDYFPHLPSYQAFCRRLNWLANAFRALAEIFSEHMIGKLLKAANCVIDSCPIMLAVNSRSNRGKVAKEECNMTRNSTRNQWYYGVKLHVVAALRAGKLPIPCVMKITPAADCDLWTAKQIFRDCPPLSGGKLYADRAYIDASWLQEMKDVHCVAIITPHKKKKLDVIVSDDAYSTFVSSMRQPIEPLFYWINQMTGIQEASHIRSSAGLFFHLCASLACAMLAMRRKYFNY